jgi:hypothetical protein
LEPFLFNEHPLDDLVPALEAFDGIDHRINVINERVVLPVHGSRYFVRREFIPGTQVDAAPDPRLLLHGVLRGPPSGSRPKSTFDESVEPGNRPLPAVVGLTW